MPYPWSAGNVLTATDLNSSLAAKYDNAPAINAQTGTTYTFVLADATAGKTITASNASASTYTVPPQSSVAFSAGALLRVTNIGAGVVTFAGGVGVTVTNTAGTLSQYQSATLVRTGSDAWTVIPSGGASGMSLVTSQTVSAVAAITFNNVFTATGRHYMLVMDLSCASAATTMTMQMRASGTNETSSNYLCRYASSPFNAGTISTDGNTNAATSFSLLRLSTTAAGRIVTLTSPQIAQWTGMHMQGLDTTSYASSGGGILQTATAYDGFSLACANNMTGTVHVYSYKS